MSPCLTKVLDRNVDAYQSGSSLVINQGGQGSSKTYSMPLTNGIKHIQINRNNNIFLFIFKTPHLNMVIFIRLSILIKKVIIVPETV